MGYPKLSVMEQTPVINTLFQQGAISKEMFSFKIADTGSSLFVGGADSSLYTGDVEYHDVDTLLGFWIISKAALYLNSKATVSAFSTIIDT